MEVDIKFDKPLYNLGDVAEMICGDSENEKARFVASKLLNFNDFKQIPKTDFYLSGKYKDLEHYIIKSADYRGVINYNNEIKSDEYDKLLSKMERDRKIIPINSFSYLKIDNYITYSNIRMVDFEEFYRSFRTYIEHHLYFSLQNVLDDINTKLFRAGFEECFAYSLIKYSGMVGEVDGIKNLFTKSKDTSRITFLERLVAEEGSVNIYDFSSDLKELNNIDYPPRAILYDINSTNTKMYYNDETEKIYKNKNKFFEEIL